MAEIGQTLDYREPEWVAEKLGLDKNTVYKYLQEGWLPGVQLGRKWLISERLLAESKIILSVTRTGSSVTSTSSGYRACRRPW